MLQKRRAKTVLGAYVCGNACENQLMPAGGNGRMRERIDVVVGVLENHKGCDMGGFESWDYEATTVRSELYAAEPGEIYLWCKTIVGTHLAETNRAAGQRQSLLWEQRSTPAETRAP